MSTPQRLTDVKAKIVILLGASLSLVAVALVLVLSQKHEIAAKAGTLGDTIGGIAGPILNFAGLLIIYFSLQEQFEANEQQKRSSSETEQREESRKNFEICLNLIDRLVRQGEKQALIVKELRREQIKFSQLTSVSHITDYTAAMQPVLVMFDTIRQIIKRAKFDRYQLQALGFILRHNYLPCIGYLSFLLEQDIPRINVGAPIVADMERVQVRIREQTTWVNAVRLTTDDAFHQEQSNP